jgi:branched-subunit amino acid aminotransferase/4-amino-4-deoxychorismate lyase
MCGLAYLIYKKAYLGPDGKARLFRPELNVARLARSTARVALPVSAGSVRNIYLFDSVHEGIQRSSVAYPNQSSS